MDRNTMRITNEYYDYYYHWSVTTFSFLNYWFFDALSHHCFNSKVHSLLNLSSITSLTTVELYSQDFITITITAVTITVATITTSIGLRSSESLATTGEFNVNIQTAITADWSVIISWLFVDSMTTSTINLQLIHYFVLIAAITNFIKSWYELYSMVLSNFTNIFLPVVISVAKNFTVSLNSR